VRPLRPLLAGGCSGSGALGLRAVRSPASRVSAYRGSPPAPSGPECHPRHRAGKRSFSPRITLTGTPLPTTFELVSWIFFATNAARILAYLPQLRSAWNCENGAASVNRLTWGYFSVAHLSGVLYALVVARDVGMAVVFLGNFAACLSLVVVITWKRRDHSRSRRGLLGAMGNIS
jgi:hypothetical protein